MMKQSSHRNAVAKTSNAQNNNPSPQHNSETSTQNVTSVIEYKDMCNQIELTNQDIQGIVYLRFEKGEMHGET